MDSFYLHSLPQPFHLSVGAVVFNEEYKICTHHFFKQNVSESLQYLMGGLDECFHLVRESIEGKESMFTAVHRGIKEELGAIGTIEKYLGSITCEIVTPNRTFEKTTIYHSVCLIELGEREIVDDESKTKLEWYTADELIHMFKEQMNQTNRPELDESIVVERFKQAYGL